jgi:Transglutaminase-like superfamily
VVRSEAMRATIGILRRSIRLVRTIWRMPLRDRLLLVEAMVALAAASLAIAILPFRAVVRLAGWPRRHAQATRERRTAAVQRVRWAVVACARHIPWRTMCFQQGLAAQWMLRCRGVPSVLCYGAAPDPRRGIASHVWVRDGRVDVVGGEVASHFAMLASFPAREDENRKPM